MYALGFEPLIKLLLRPKEIYFLMISYLFSLTFNRALDLSAIDEGFIKSLLIHINELLIRLTSPGAFVNYLFLLFTASLLILSMAGRRSRFGKDILAVFLSICWIVELVSINLLLIAPIKDPTLLLIELLLFFPIIIVSFTWWYWRINLNNSRQNGDELRPITFKASESVLNYFYLSVDTFFKYQPSYVSFNTIAAKSLHMFHAMIKLDVLGLALGRAVSLASSI